jgi:GT2 family glycosyltransferase
MLKPDSPFPPDLVLTPVSRQPARLPDETVQAVLARPVPEWGLPAVAQLGLSAARASIIVVSYNNLVFTRLCLESVLANTDHSNYEIIVVDNASSDHTAAYLRELSQRQPHLRVLYNDCNLGFARANNQALTVATGEVLVLLNNDTIVPPGFLRGLIRHLEDPTIGLIGPVTNRICNEAQIDADYQTYGELIQFARNYMAAHEGETFDIRMLAMYCVAMRRAAFQRIGLLDEQYEVGMLEDDDYAMRVREAGYRLVCAEDVFVHHFDKASFGHLVPTGDYGRLLDANRRRFEQKWGVSWEPYGRRRSRQYQDLTRRIQQVVQEVLPPDATVIVVSKGDDALLELDGRRAWHFPQDEEGNYAGYYPADSEEAILQLESLRRKGADFLLFPKTALWWLDHYHEFRTHMETCYQVIPEQEDLCTIFVLR